MKISVLALFFGLTLTATGAIDPYYKEAIERGYKIKGGSVVFTDGSTCLYKSFIDGACGQKWKTTDYCVPEGKPVWDTTRCCEGLQAHILPQSDGQTTCERMPGKAIKSRLQWLYWFFPGVLVLILLFALRNYVNNKKRSNSSN